MCPLFLKPPYKSQDTLSSPLPTIPLKKSTFFYTQGKGQRLGLKIHHTPLEHLLNFYFYNWSGENTTGEVRGQLLKEQVQHPWGGEDNSKTGD